MPKLIVKFNNAVVDQFDVAPGEIKIGRKTGCAIILDHLAVSGEHAVITTTAKESVIQDLNSTNGTFIDNKRINRHPLKNGDVVVIGQHSLIYVDDVDTAPSDTIVRGKSAPGTPHPATEDNRTIRIKHGQLFVLEGPNTGKRIELVKAVTDLDMSGKNSGAITRAVEGYRLVPATGQKVSINGKAVTGGTALQNGDTIELSGAKLQFYFK